MTIKELYQRLPKLAEAGKARPPSKDALQGYIASIGAAYAQAGLEPAAGAKHQKRPGFVDKRQHYMFQVAMMRNPVGYERGEFIAESRGSELVLHGLVGAFDGMHSRSAAALTTSIYEVPRKFPLTADSLGLATSFIMEKCAAGLFVPVEPSVPRTADLVKQL